jgi:hypothetical protein
MAYSYCFGMPQVPGDGKDIEEQNQVAKMNVVPGAIEGSKVKEGTPSPGIEQEEDDFSEKKTSPVDSSVKTEPSPGSQPSPTSSPSVEVKSTQFKTLELSEKDSNLTNASQDVINELVKFSKEAKEVLTKIDLGVGNILEKKETFRKNYSDVVAKLKELKYKASFCIAKGKEKVGSNLK